MGIDRASIRPHRICMEPFVPDVPHSVRTPSMDDPWASPIGAPLAFGMTSPRVFCWRYSRHADQIVRSAHELV